MNKDAHVQNYRLSEQICYWLFWPFMYSKLGYICSKYAQEVTFEQKKKKKKRAKKPSRTQISNAK